MSSTNACSGECAVSSAVRSGTVHHDKAVDLEDRRGVGAPTEASRRWAALLQQIFEVDPLACPTCQGAMRIVAVITQTAVIDRILTHLRTRGARRIPCGVTAASLSRRRSRGDPCVGARAVGDGAVCSTDPD